MPKKKDDALARAVADVRAAWKPIQALLDEERAEERREREAERRRVERARVQLLRIAPSADAWFRDWVRRGRLALALDANVGADERDQLSLPTIHIAGDRAVWAHELRRPQHGPHHWYEIDLGTPHRVRGGLRGTRMGGVGGPLGTFSSFAQLARQHVDLPPSTWWQMLLAATLVAELLSSNELEAMLLEQLRGRAAGLASRSERMRIETAVHRRERGAETRYREIIARDRLATSALTPDALVHLARRVRPRVE
ncbi:MAG: hypothetical protein U0234_22865 [Sandaracinus sp.]